MRFLAWVCRVILVVVIAAFVATVFYLTHSVSMSEGAKAALNWVTVAGTTLLGLSWPLMRRYWQALLLLVGLGVARALFGTGPGLSTLSTPLLTPFQSDFLWVSIGVAFVALVGAIAARAIISDRRMRAMKQAASTVTTGQDVAAQTAVALQESEASSEPEMAAPEASETVAPPREPEEEEAAAAETPEAEDQAKKPAEPSGKKK